MFILKCRDLALRGQAIDVRGKIYQIGADSLLEVENEDHAAILLQMQSFALERIRPAKIEFHSPTVEVLPVDEIQLPAEAKSETIVDQKPARRRGK